MTGIRGFLLLFFLIAASNVNAIEQIDFELNGLKVGDKLTEQFKKKYCPKKSEGKKELECKKELTINGVDVSARFFFNDLSLITVSLTYDSKTYPDLVKAYSKSFSRGPHKNIKEAIDIGTGKKYTNEKVLWKTNSGDFTIEKYGSNLTRGYAYLNSPEYIQYLETKEKPADVGTIRNIFNQVFK